MSAPTAALIVEITSVPLPLGRFLLCISLLNSLNAQMALLAPSGSMQGRREAPSEKRLVLRPTCK